MATVKTAISIEKKLFEELTSLAKKMRVSRSHLFSMAAKELIEKAKNRRLLQELNEAYQDGGEEEQGTLEQMMALHREMLKGEW